MKLIFRAITKDYIRICIHAIHFQQVPIWRSVHQICVKDGDILEYLWNSQYWTVMRECKLIIHITAVGWGWFWNNISHLRIQTYLSLLEDMRIVADIREMSELFQKMKKQLTNHDMYIPVCLLHGEGNPVGQTVYVLIIKNMR